MLICSIISYGQQNDSILVKVVQPKVFLIKDKWHQQINFDISVENQTLNTIELTKIKLYIYNKNSLLSNVMELNKGAVSSSISTIPIRFTDKNKKTTVFNPFTIFKPYVDLSYLKYKLSFVNDRGDNYNKEIIVKPKLYIPKTNLTLPLKEKIMVVDGNDYYSNHRRFDINNPLVSNLLDINTTPNLLAIDFSIIDNAGTRYINSSKKNSNYYIFGNTIYATADGKVVKAIDIFNDNEPGKLNFNVADARTNRDLLTGNCIIIDHLNGEYSFFIHLKRGTVLVKEGETVKQGQAIAQVGNSGSSMQPHLHYQLSDKPDYIEGNNLPIYFHNYYIMSGNKKLDIAKGYINTGDIIKGK